MPQTYAQPMPEGPGSDHSFRDPRAKHTRPKILNESWPDDARHLKDQPDDKQVEVTVRVDFADTGVELLEGRAIRWNRSHVCVVVNDRRLLTPYLWVRARDVRRRKT